MVVELVDVSSACTCPGSWSGSRRGMMLPLSCGARAIAGFGLFIWWTRQMDRLRQRRTRVTLQIILESESWRGPETPTLASYNPILGDPQVGVIIIVRGPGGA